MTGPVEVVLVTRREKRPGVAFVSSLLGLLGAGFVNGWLLMLLLPIAAEVLGTPDRHPGYFPCVALALVVRGLIAGITQARPLARVSS